MWLCEGEEGCGLRGGGRGVACEGEEGGVWEGGVWLVRGREGCGL